MKKFIIFIVVVLVIVAVVALLGFGGGFGMFGGNNSGDGTSGNISASQTEESSQSEVESNGGEGATLVEITVSGREYIYQNQKIELDAFIAELDKIEGEVEIRISSDETATVNAMDELTNKLEEKEYNNYYKTAQ